MTEHGSRKTAQPRQRLSGLLAEYKSPSELLHAAEKVKAAGYERWDTFTPFPVHGIDRAMGIKATRLPWVVLCAGLTGATCAVSFQWWTSTQDYPWIVSGKPFFSLPANIPITFELMVLFSALTAFFAMLLFNKLPHPSHPLDNVRRFDRSTDDRFFVFIDAADPRFDREGTMALLQKTEPHAGIEEVLDESTEAGESVPRGVKLGLLIASAAAATPFALAALARVSKSETPRVHIVPDMDFQQKFKAQADNAFFADHRSMRLPVEGTIAVGELREDPHLYQGKQGDGWATRFPESVELSDATMERGRVRFNTYCSPCHGEDGSGQGMVHQRAASLLEGTWVPPTVLTDEPVRQKPVGELFSAVSNGIRNMPAYGRQISAEDRWAIILYLRALQRAQGARLDALPAELRGSLQ